MKKLLFGIVALLSLSLAAQAADRRGDFELKPADRTLGNRAAKVVLIEYGSFSCSHCAAFNEEVMPLLRKNYIDNGKVFYVFRQFPRNPQDALAEKMARCAPAERYFPIADLLFKEQAKWAPGSGVEDWRGALVKLGAETGLSPVAINRCMDSKADDARINAVADEADKRYALTGTPHLVINGKAQESGGIPYPALAKLLDQAAAGR